MRSTHAFGLDGGMAYEPKYPHYIGERILSADRPAGVICVCCKESDVKETSLDLHGYPLADAIEIASLRIEEAFENGLDYIEIIHGAPDIRSSLHASISGGRGSIKWALRGLLANGEWKQYVFNRRSKKHQIHDGAMRLRLRVNPTPHAQATWSEVPTPTYGHGRRKR